MTGRQQFNTYNELPLQGRKILNLDKHSVPNLRIKNKAISKEFTGTTNEARAHNYAAHGKQNQSTTTTLLTQVTDLTQDKCKAKNKGMVTRFKEDNSVIDETIQQQGTAWKIDKQK
ncbi:hypothetical protein KY285_030322 [Solanum tuberosum]|nr:hypothetical protein KY289_030450 [Solanum tuberosum]KAH0655440.1 hypothetical protein KY285_030322 [Solanum tuberosum]